MTDIMKECKPNSHKYKTEQKENTESRKVEKVVYGQVKKKKKSEVQKFKSKYLSEDSDSVVGYFLNDMIIPAAKKMASDVLDNFVDFIRDSIDKQLYGESRGSSRHPTSRYERTSYGKYFNNRSKRDRDTVVLKAKSGFDYDPIFFSKRGDAEAVLKELQRLIQKYKLVSVCDMYRAANLDCPYTYENYGWMDISDARVVREYYENEPGYIIDLPRPLPFD